MTDAAIVAGTANPRLARAVADQIGLPLADTTIERHPDGEVHVVLRESVRRRTVVIVQPTSPPVDDHLIELVALVDAARRAAAARIVAVVPYFGYARSDRRRGRRGPIMASVVARLLETAGVDHLIGIDLHTPQVEGYFACPVDALSATPVLGALLAGRLDPDTVVVSPDLGRVAMAGEVADILGLDSAVLQKRRDDGLATRVLGVVGDVRDRPCVIVDDILATGGTIVEAIDALRLAGARPSTLVAVVHALLLDDAADRLAKAAVREIVATDTVCHPEIQEPQLRIGTVAPLIGSALTRLLEP
jgi:ribose-phosphate pyrophosphokinase